MEEIRQFGLAASGSETGVSRTDLALPLAARAGANALQKQSTLENAFVLCVLVFSTSAFVNFFPGEHGLEYDEQGLLFAQILWSFLYLVMLFFVRHRIMEFVRLMWQSKLLVLLLGWACVSVVWSVDRQVTIRHCVALLFTSLFGVYFGTRFDLHKQLRLVSMALGIVVVASVGACLAFPEYGISSENLLEEPPGRGSCPTRIISLCWSYWRS